jgi:hypothetical protein
MPVSLLAALHLTVLVMSGQDRDAAAASADPRSRLPSSG